MRMLMVVALAVSFAAACGSSSSETTCEQVVDKVLKHMEDKDVSKDELAKRRENGLEACKAQSWSAETRACMMKATSGEKATQCIPPSSLTPMKKSKGSEAETNVKRMYQGARAHHAEKSQVPQGRVGPTPAVGSCCPQKCAPSPALWEDPLWMALQFTVDDPHYYSYEYEGSATGFTVRALGDLDCDSIYATFEIISTVNADGTISAGAITKQNESD